MMRMQWGVLWMVVLACVGPAAAQPPSEAHAGKWALIIGIDQYTHLDRLRFCGQDAQALRSRLGEIDFPEDSILTLQDGDARYPAPLKKNIESSLSQMLQNVKEGDVVLVGFSGHGITLNGEGYLCPKDAVPDRTDTLISVNWLYQQLAKCPAEQRVLVIDACRDDPTLGRRSAVAGTGGERQFVHSLPTPPVGIVVLASCAPGQRSLESTQFKNGIFMHYVVEGLGGPADSITGNHDGRVSFLELYNYASTKTRQTVAEMFFDLQTSTLRGEILGDFDLGIAIPSEPPPQAVIQPTATGSEARIAGFRTAVLTLEAAINWDAVAEKWGERRDGWIAEVNASTQVATLAQLTLELEQHTLWSAVSTEWSNIRPDWVARCQSATKPGDLAEILLAFESHVLWSAVQELWLSYRDPWVQFVGEAGKE